MSSTENCLLIADWHGALGVRCESVEVRGEIWLRRHEGFLAVYWEACATPFELCSSQGGDAFFTDLCGAVVRDGGGKRWRTLCMVPAETLPPEIRDLEAAFRDDRKREVLLAAAIRAVEGQTYIPLGRGTVRIHSHRWWECRHERLG
jgi:hypothetical protein